MSRRAVSRPRPIVSRSPRRSRDTIWVSPALLVLLALAGTWLAHNLEYLRVWGPGQFSNALSRSAHTYMGPVGLALLSFAVLALYGTVALGRQLERRLAQLDSVLRTGSVTVHENAAQSRSELRPVTLMGVLWIVQMGLYLTQENLEARVVGLPAPGLGALTGVHRWAPLVHLGVAVIGAGVAWLARRRITALAGQVDAVTRLLAVRTRQRVAALTTIAHGRSWTPLERWGVQLWSRPPPVIA